MKQILFYILLSLTIPHLSFAESDKSEEIELFIHSIIIDNDSLDLSKTPTAFNEINVGEIIDSIINEKESLGYYYTKVTIERVAKFENYVNLYLTSSEGPRVKIRSLKFEGLKRTDPEFLKRYYPEIENQLFSQALVEQLENGSSEIAFLEFEKPPYLEAVAGYQSFDLVIPVKESKTIIFNGGAGLIQDDGDLIVWDVKLDFVNPFGNGRELSILSEKRDRNNQILGFNFRQPIFLIGIDKLDLSIRSRDYRDLFYEFSVDGKYTVNLQSRWQSSLTLSAKNVEPESNLNSYRTFGSEFILNYKSKITTRGFSKLNISWSIAYSYRKYKTDSTSINSGQSLNESRNEIGIGLTQPLAGDLVPFISLKYMGLETSEDIPPVSELYLIGGPGTVRSYRNEQFPAVRSLLATFEPRIYFKQSYLFGFIDAGLIHNRFLDLNSRVDSENIWKSGYGFGFYLRGERNKVKLSFGWNEDLSIDQPRLSIELTSSF